MGENICESKHGKPEKLLELRSDGFEFNPNPLLRVLEKVGERPVAIYSINGPAGTGKSFLLNYFLRYLITNGKDDWMSTNLEEKFSWRGGSGRNTKGMLIWSEPFILKRKSDEKEVGVILIDTQGSFDQEATMKDNAIVFALSTLISSVLIFNTKANGRDIGEDKLQFLQFFAGYARLTDEKNENEPFQKLIFLLRDFDIIDYEYGYYDDLNTATTGKNFKKEMLDPRKEQPEQVQIVHSKILSNFRSVGCYLMPHPGKELTRKDNPSGMDADFKEHLKLFTESILNTENIVSKRIGRAELDGRQLMRFAKMWSDKFNNSKLPEVASLFDSTANIHNAMSKKLAMEHFNVKMDDYMKEMPRGMNQFQFDERFNLAIKSAIEILRSLKPMGDKNVVDDLMEELMNDIKSQHKWFLMANEHNTKFLQLEERYSEKVALIEKSLDNNRKRLTELSAKNNFFSWEEKERIASQMEEYKKQMEELLKNVKMESGQKNKKISDLEKEIQQIRMRRDKRES